MGATKYKTTEKKKSDSVKCNQVKSYWQLNDLVHVLHCCILRGVSSETNIKFKLPTIFYSYAMVNTRTLT